MDDEYHRSRAEEKSYYSVAHTVHEHVTEQATIMVNGKLKEYQVRHPNILLHRVLSFIAAEFILKHDYQDYNNFDLK